MSTKLQMACVLGAAAMAIGCAAAGPASALDPQPDYGRYAETTFLPYLNATGAQLRRLFDWRGNRESAAQSEGGRA